MGSGVFPGGKERPGRDADPSPFLESWSRKSIAIPLLPLWAVRPVQNLSTWKTVNFTFTLHYSFTLRMEIKTIPTHTASLPGQQNAYLWYLFSDRTWCVQGLNVFLQHSQWCHNVTEIFPWYLHVAANLVIKTRSDQKKKLARPSTLYLYTDWWSSGIANTRVRKCALHKQRSTVHQPHYSQFALKEKMWHRNWLH